MNKIKLEMVRACIDDLVYRGQIIPLTLVEEFAILVSISITNR